MPYIGRLAPSPTGLLHLGHAATFLIAHARARAAGGKLILRIDDLDPQRSKEHFITAAREDLLWLGLSWDEETRQSEHLAAYGSTMVALLASGLAYPCCCSRKDLQQATQAPHEDTDDEPVYNGHCRSKSSQQHALQPNTNYRLRIPNNELIRFTDGHCGPQRFLTGCTPQADLGDFLVWRKDGLPSYQLASVVDDAGLGITEVARGRDLLKSTARQILLQRVLNLPTPAWFHTDLLRNEEGERLAKRHDALSLRTLRNNGVTPAQIRALLAPHLHLS